MAPSPVKPIEKFVDEVVKVVSRFAIAYISTGGLVATAVHFYWMYAQWQILVR